MTATLERPTTTRERQLEPERSGKRPPASPGDQTLGRYLLWALAALSLGAGAIHFAVSGGHFGLSWKHGVFFAVAAWLQLAWAAAIVLRPSRKLFVAAILVNAALIATWVVSRVWGVPVGPNAWTPEDVAFADVAATAFEGAIVLGALALLLRPALSERRVRPLAGLSPLAVTGIGVAVVSTIALTPSFASATHGAASGQTAAGHGSDAAAGSTAEDGGEAGGSVAGHTNNVVSADGTSACEQAGVANEGNSGHGERGPVPFTPMDAATRAAYQQEVAVATGVVQRYPTVADAEAAGYSRVTPYVPCIAAHYLKSAAFTNGFDPNEPEIMLFEGTEPTSKVVGLSYLQFADPKVAPEGFTGPNDPWHVHSQLCIGGGGVLGDENTTKEQCEERGGKVIPLDNLWMNHMWPVAGWESRWGLFSSEHPDLGGRIGDINGEPKPEDELNETNPNKKK